jgi:hypothetical protein
MGRLVLLLATLGASTLLFALVTLAAADARACIEWDGGLHTGHDDRTRPFSTTWAVFAEMMARHLWEPGDLAVALVVCSAPFVPLAVGALCMGERGR